MNAKPNLESGSVVLEVGRDEEKWMGMSNPFRLKTILVPTDFSNCSMKALQYALPFAKQNSAAITLLHVIPPPTPAGAEYGSVDFPAIETNLREGAERELLALAATKVHGAVPTEATVRMGSATTEILRLARELPADLIVIATHGRTGLKHVFLGSVTEHVVRSAPCPVLVVRESEHEFLAS